ncbi:MAG: DAK2 domain-containing protein [Clostridia bacterium]|nr:DAK2 domain-containing protein [Clostridia bacterium]
MFKSDENENKGKKNAAEPKKPQKANAENTKQRNENKASDKVKATKNSESKLPMKKEAENSKSKKSPAKKDAKKENTKSAKKTEAKASANQNKQKKISLKNLGGILFAKMLRGGASELRANAEEVNKLNVFPVPDGDTGDNMSMTIDSGVAPLNNIETDDLAEVLKVASRGMLLGARGNSGVILSQFFAGMAKGLENVETANSKELGHALELGVEQAYTSVMTPTEGTILTVAREAVEYAVSRITPRSTVQTLFADLVKEMNASLERTPELLPALSEAGVVDSGGAGLLYIIDGLNRVLNGEEIDADFEPITMPTKSAQAESAFGPDSEMTYGYCTELLVQLQNKKTDIDAYNIDALKLYLSKIGDSIVAFKTESIVKIHVHTMTPERVLAYMRKVGEFISVKIENMSIQHTELQENDDKYEQKEKMPKIKNGIVMVSNGPGIEALFRELGANEIVSGGQTNNPSTSDFIDAFKKINAENIFVFPNNSNIMMAASQAAEIYEDAKVYVVPAKTIGAGYVALSSMNFDTSSPEELLTEADEAISRVTSAYISPAIRDADMNGVHVNEGDTIGIMNKEIVVSNPDKKSAAFALIDLLLKSGDKFMLTVFVGTDATAEEGAILEDYVRSTYPDVEIYSIDGGQEIYPYIFVAE